jgi:hypothetical protein
MAHLVNLRMLPSAKRLGLLQAQREGWKQLHSGLFPLPIWTIQRRAGRVTPCLEVIRLLILLLRNQEAHRMACSELPRSPIPVTRRRVHLVAAYLEAVRYQTLCPEALVREACSSSIRSQLRPMHFLSGRPNRHVQVSILQYLVPTTIGFDMMECHRSRCYLSIRSFERGCKFCNRSFEVRESVRA